MLFPDDALFEYVLLDLAEAMADQPNGPMLSLPCDRWIARSCLQKAIRRGEAALAQRALANLFEHDRRATWRHLAIIAVEDIGVANVDLLAQVVAAQRDRRWRSQMGGDWAVLAALVRQMAESNHCQAACDLLLRATNDPLFERSRMDALDADMEELMSNVIDGDLPLIKRGIAALAAGGGLAEGQQHSDPSAVFEAMADVGRFSHVVATCRSGWKVARNPMMLLLPLVWQEWSRNNASYVANDPRPRVQLTSGIPGYALDQFTRRGNAVSRTLLAATPELMEVMEAAGVGTGKQAATIGDLVFLWEGSAANRRVVWQVADHLRHPYRCLSGVVRLGHHCDAVLRIIEAKGSQIEKLRWRHLTSSSANSAL